MANVGACWARAGTRLMQHSRGGKSEWTATVRGGAVSGRTENGGVVLSPVTGEHQARADGWRRTDEGAFKRKGAGAKAATAAAAAATATGGETEERGELGETEERRVEWRGTGRGRGETRLPLAWRDR